MSATQNKLDADRIMFFDGHCNLCNGGVDFLLRRMTKKGRHNLKFAPLQGQTAQTLLKPEDVRDLNTVVYWQRAKNEPESAANVHRRSGAILRIFATLGFPWNLCLAGLAMPPFIRNAIYNWIAVNRYSRWGRRNSCRIPTPQERSHFLP